MGAVDFGRSIFAVDANQDITTTFRNTDAFGIDAQIDAFALEDLAYRGRDVGILVMDDTRGDLDNSDLAAKATVHLGEFEPDIATADNHQMPRQKIDRHHRGVRQIGDLIEPRQLRRRRPRSDIDEDPLGGESSLVEFDLVWPAKARMALVDCAF